METICYVKAKTKSVMALTFFFSPAIPDLTKYYVTHQE